MGEALGASILSSTYRWEFPATMVYQHLSVCLCYPKGKQTKGEENLA